MDIGARERARLLAREPRIDDVMNSLQGLSRLPRRSYANMKNTIALARDFTDRYVRPVYKDLDLRMHRDNDYLPHEFIAEASRWHLFSRWVPKMFGGHGMDFLTLYPFLEEISSVCTGLANVIGVHYLGVGTLCSTWNSPLMVKILGEVCRGDRRGEPCLISLAITEPEAGTDVEEPALLEKARIGTTARRVEGGYLLNGRKIFISNGHVSAWHMVIAYEDARNPVETTVMAAVRTGSAGFSFGRHEKKMGQKICVASELVFDECFVPDSLVCISPGQYRSKKKTPREISQYLIDFVVSSSRAGVGAFAAGAARGAYETALNYARKKMVAGKPLVSRQWAQTELASMYANVCAARALYMESAYANALKGMFKLLYRRLFFYFFAFMPRWYFLLWRPFLKTRLATKLYRRYYFDRYSGAEAQASSGWASLSKFWCSDLAMETCAMALRLMGIDGARHDTGVEKYLRDAKLLQIYEGTNQLNRLNLFKNLAARDIPEAELFK